MKWIRKALKGISLTSAMFVFQACYGTGPDLGCAETTFHVVSDETGEPLEGIAVFMGYRQDADTNDISKTDEEGNVSFIICSDGDARYGFSIYDNESVYDPVDTVVNIFETDTVEVRLKKRV